jgi:hypothetical protein
MIYGWTAAVCSATDLQRLMVAELIGAEAVARLIRDGSPIELRLYASRAEPSPYLPPPSPGSLRSGGRAAGRAA